MDVPKTMPEWDWTKWLEDPIPCSWEAGREKREAMREHDRQAGLCQAMRRQRGLEKILALAGKGGRD